jgi:porin
MFACGAYIPGKVETLVGDKMSKFRVSEAAAVWLGVVLGAAVVGPAFADDVPAAPPAGDGHILSVSGDITVDGIAPLQGGANHRVRELDKADLVFGFDFDKLGWHGGTAQLTVQNTSGQIPNADLGTIEGVDNDEVSIRRLRLFEAWVQQDFPNDRGSVKAGLIDVSSEFYVNGASSVLMAPQFGIGTELAATGPGGPSTFPQTGLAARLIFKPTKDTYLQAGAYNALVGDPGDRGGVDTSFDQGVIEIAEGGWSNDKGKLALGLWRYSKKQDDLFDVNGRGAPIKRTSNGAYILAERVLLDGGDKGMSFSGFFRGGLSDGDTGPAKGGWQLGGLLSHPFAARPDGQFSFGVDQAMLGDKFRLASAAGGLPPKASETHFEITYADQLTKHVLIQPDLQYILDPGGDGAAKNELVFLLRFKGTF